MSKVGRSVAVICALALLLIGCDRDLGNGYKVVRVDASNTVITHSTFGIIIDADVAFYEVHDKFVVGLRNISIDPQYNWETASEETLGYFIINMKTYRTWKGMSRDELWQTLRELFGSDAASHMMSDIPE